MAYPPTSPADTAEETVERAAAPLLGRQRCHPRLRPMAALALVAVALLPMAASRPVPTWATGFHDATCVGPCCLITDGFFELSCGEYPHPPGK